MQILDGIQQELPQDHVEQQIQEPIQQELTASNAKYYQFYTVATILEHVINCLHTIVSDETNPYHPPLSWLSRRQIRPPDEELFLDIVDECSTNLDTCENFTSSVRARLEKISKHNRKEIVARTKDGCPPLFIACKQGHLNKARYLLDICDADLEQKGLFETVEDHHVHYVTPIWVAAVSGNLEIVKLLLDYGANINSLSDTGSTPLRSVCFLCKDDDRPSQSNQNSTDNENAFNEPVFGFDNGQDHQQDSTQDVDRYFQIVKLLVDSGADISKPNYNGGTCLINSIHNLELTVYLLDHGCDVNASDNQSKTALHYAIQQNRVEVTKTLLARGADPTLTANLCDDALQLSCLSSNEDIFEHLIKNIEYPTERLADAYKLMGSSILEMHFDLTKVRLYWSKALELEQQVRDRADGGNYTLLNPKRVSTEQCDRRRAIAYADITEIDKYPDLLLLTADEFRIQSLIISERILGLDHRETVQRLLHRGTFYANCLRPDRCLDLWIYALKLRLKYESIFHFESIFSSQAIAKLFSDLLSQSQHLDSRDIHDLLSLLIDQLDQCRQHLEQRPVNNLHEDIFDILLGIIVNLLLACKIVEPKQPASVHETNKLVRRLTQFNPKTSDGSSLLHVCVNLDIFYGDIHKLLSTQRSMRHGGTCNVPQESLVWSVIDTLIKNGIEIDSTNREGLSPLQVLCLSGTRLVDKQVIIRHLVRCGAHLDRHSPAHEQTGVIRQSLREAGVNPDGHLRLTCLAARRLANHQRSRLKSCQSRTCAHLLETDKPDEYHYVVGCSFAGCQANNKELASLPRQLKDLIAIH